MPEIPNDEHLNFNTPPTWIPLFQVELPSETKYLTPNTEEVVYDGHTYERFPVKLETITHSGTGEVSTVRLSVSDVGEDGEPLGMWSTLLRTYGSLDGYTLTFMVYSVDAEDVIYEENLDIIRCMSVDNKVCIFDLGTFNPTRLAMLMEKYMTDFCWHVYKGEGCWITKRDGTHLMPTGFVVSPAGIGDTCAHRQSDCRLHMPDNVLRADFFPGIPGRGGYI